MTSADLLGAYKYPWDLSTKQPFCDLIRPPVTSFSLSLQGVVKISLNWGDFHVLEEKIKERGSVQGGEKRLSGEEAKRKGIGVVMGSEMVGKERGGI